MAVTIADDPAQGYERAADRVEGRPTRHKSSDTILKAKATAARATFKRPAFWVMAFGWFLAFCAGLVNVVAMLSWNTFVSHVTGTTTAIGLRIEGYHNGRHDFDRLGDSIALLLSFLFGAFLCGLLIDKNQVHLGGKAAYGVALIGNGVLLILSVFVTHFWHQFTVAACLAAVACGLQNAMCTSHFGAVVRTTHVTGTVTDIGSTLGRMSMLLLRRGCRRSRLNILERAEFGVDARKLLVLGPMWLSFLLGCIVGAYLGSLWGVYTLFVPAGFTTVVGTVYMLFRQSFKQYFVGLMRDRLSTDLEDVETSLARTQGYLSGLRKGQPQSEAGSAASHANSPIDLEGLEMEVEHILDSIHQVEVDIEDLRSQDGTPFHRSERSAPASETGSQKV